MKKIFILLPLLLVGLVSCGENNNSTSEGTPSTSTQSPSTSTPQGTSTSTTTPSTDKGSETNPYTVAEALDVAKALEADAYSDNEVCVTGFVVDKPGTKNGSRKYSFNIVDDLSETTEQLYVYLTKNDTGVADAYQNDKVTVKAYLQNFKGNTYEITGKKLDNNNYTDSLILSVTTGTSKITAVEVDHATITLDQTSGTNGSTFTFAVAVDTGYVLDAVKVNGATVTESEGKYTGTIAGDTQVTVDLHGENEQVPQMVASINLSGHAGTLTGEGADQTMVFTENGITVTCIKNSSTTPLALQSQYEQRFYQNSTLKVEYTSAFKYVVFTCYSNNKTLNGQTVDGLTITEDAAQNTIKIELDTPATSFEIEKLAKQIRVGLVQIYA